MKHPQQLGRLYKTIQSKSERSDNRFKWRVWLGLLMVIVLSLLDWDWIWGILFLIWIIPDLGNGVTYFIEPVYKAKNPLLYWGVVVTWVGLSILSFSTLF